MNNSVESYRLIFFFKLIKGEGEGGCG
jgi:hypothetical protein